MRKIILLQALLIVAEAHLLAQAVPYNTSSVSGSTIITNYYDPNAGPNVGPGLSISPLNARLYGPLGSWSSQAAPTPATVSATYASPTVSATYATPATVLTSPVTTYGNTNAVPSYSVPANQYGVTNALPAPAVPATLYGTGVVPSDSNPATLPRLTPRFGNFQTPAYDVNGQPLPPRVNVPLVPVAPGPESYGGYPSEPTYFFPGLVRQNFGQWVGSDYLYNMYSNIGVVVEIVTPTDLPNPISSDEIKQNVSEIFANGGINPYAEAFLEQPPLPFFYMIIMVTQVENSYTFSISGRFFESVKIPRLNFKTPGTSQAITWERQELVTTSQNRLVEQLVFSAREIADLFVQRVRYFNFQKIEQDEMLKMRCGPSPTIKCPHRLRSMGSRAVFD